MASNSVKFLSHKCECTKEKQFIENTMQLEIVEDGRKFPF